MSEAALGHPGAVATSRVPTMREWFSALPASAWAYWAAVVVAALVAAAIAAADLGGGHWGRFAMLATAASIAQLSSVRLSGRRTFHPAMIFVVAGALTLSAPQLVLMCLIQHLPEWLRQRYRWYVQPHNVANYILSGLAGWYVAHSLDVAPSGRNFVVAGVLATMTFMLVNRLLLWPMIRLSRGLSLRETRLAAVDDLVLELVLALMALPLVAAWSRSVALAAISLAPLVLIEVAQRATKRLVEASELIHEQNASLEEAHRVVMQRATNVLETLSATVDARDRYTAGHSRRVAAVSIEIARELGLEGPELELVSQAALLHDIGKLGVPDGVLRKHSELSQGDWLVMRSHPEEGARIVERLGYLDEVVPAIRHHHERLDGRGYPDGLIGDEIPLAARIIHVADAFDAMTTRRVYREPFSVVEALVEIHRGRGADFCPDCVSALERALRQGRLVGLGPMRPKAVA